MTQLKSRTPRLFMVIGGLMLCALAGVLHWRSLEPAPEVPGNRRSSSIPSATDENHKDSLIVQGTITDAERGTPLANAIVSCTFSSNQAKSIRASHNGFYELEVPEPPVELRVDVVPSSEAAEFKGTVRVSRIPKPDSRGRILVDAQVPVFRRVAFVGTVVTDSSIPVRDAQILLAASSEGRAIVEHTAVDDAGRYELVAHIALGKYMLEVSAFGHRSLVKEVAILDWSPRMQVWTDFHLEKEGVLRGRVLSPSGQVVHGATVSVVVRRSVPDVEDVEQNDYTDTPTNELGEFAVHFGNEGHVYLSVTHPLYATVVQDLGSASKFSELPNGEVRFKEFRAGVAVTGVCLTKDGNAIRPDDLHLLRPVKSYGDPEGSIYVPTGDGGNFTVMLEEGAEYWIIAKKEGFHAATLTLTSKTSQPVRLVLTER